jgi:exosome complex component RRP45
VADYDGNLIDSACIGVLAGLQHFRRPDIDVKEGQVTVFGLDERVPVPLNITHKPLAISFHVFHEGRTVILDATRREEQASEGDMIIALNSSGETCALYKSAGSPVSAIDVVNKTTLAAQKVQQLNNIISKALEADSAKRAKQSHGAEASAENDR